MRTGSIKRGRGIWVFAYGSLLWEGGLDRFARFPALLRGYRRALCIYSRVYRGTSERPGLVLGLMPGGSCRGLAYRIPGREAAAVLRRISARENVTGVYERRLVPLMVWEREGRPRRVIATAFVAKRDHPQYAGSLPRPAILRLLRQGKGEKGTASAYLARTVQCLEKLGIHDRALARINVLAGGKTARGRR